MGKNPLIYQTYLKIEETIKKNIGQVEINPKKTFLATLCSRSDSLDSGRIKADTRFVPRLGAHSNCSSVGRATFRIRKTLYEIFDGGKRNEKMHLLHSECIR